MLRAILVLELVVAIFVVGLFAVLLVCACGYFPYTLFYKAGRGDDIPGMIDGAEDLEPDYT